MNRIQSKHLVIRRFTTELKTIFIYQTRKHCFGTWADTIELWAKILGKRFLWLFIYKMESKTLNGRTLWSIIIRLKKTFDWKLLRNKKFYNSRNKKREQRKSSRRSLKLTQRVRNQKNMIVSQTLGLTLSSRFQQILGF